MSVRDTGVGIPLVDQERIFEPYQRHQGEFKEESGTGLGLPISHAILANMGTELRVESQVGFGSCFFFDLVSAKPRIDGALVPLQSLEGLRVLVAEDQAPVAVVLCSDCCHMEMFASPSKWPCWGILLAGILDLVVEGYPKFWQRVEQ